jgi:muramidase (phage lysozyme)
MIFTSYSFKIEEVERMAFINDSVGDGGKNLSQDVKTIQWMLIRAQSYYGLRLFSKAYKISEDGIASNDLYDSIRDIVIIYPYKSLTKAIDSSSLIYDFSSSQKPIIFPNDISYTFLLSCAIKPVCTVCVDNIYVKVDFYDDSLVRQAMIGEINYQTFKHAVEIRDGIMECQTLTKGGIEAKELLKAPRVRAFLDTLAFAEGNTNYDTAFGSTIKNPKVIEDLATHPNTTAGGSSASGRYQFKTDTWNEAKKKLGLTDFTPESEDIASVYKMKTRGVLDALLANNFPLAIESGSAEWASLPFKDGKSRYTFNGVSQPIKTLAELQTVFNGALARYNLGKN